MLSSLAMGEEPVTLYAVFRQAITLSYSGNGNTGGTTAAQTGYKYYNNGNEVNPTFTLAANGFSKTGYSFSKWALSSTSGTQYAAGASITLSASATMYAVWTSNAHYFTPLNSVTWTASDTRGQEYSLTPSANSIQLKCKKAEGATAYGGISANATIPTGGCKKVRFTVNSYSGYGAVTCNGTRKSVAGQSTTATDQITSKNIDFDISGSSINVTLSTSEPTAASTATLTLTSIYFYN